MIGVLFYRKSVLHAFLRGRKSNGNFYKQNKLNVTILEQQPGAVRKQIEPISARKSEALDYFTFIIWCLVVSIVHLCYFLLFCYAIKLLFGISF